MEDPAGRTSHFTYAALGAVEKGDVTSANSQMGLRG